jgi:beta-lactamase superfamily II metal-dependent hydrolase
LDIYTLNIGQGQFVVVTGPREALVIDTFVPLNPARDVINVKAALTKILAGKGFKGLMVTGFDADHFNEVGMKIVLNKYRPDWIMYPKYYKRTDSADACFRAIQIFDAAAGIKRYSISLEANDRRFYSTLSEDFQFEVFSPHAADMNSSNNCSLVCKIKEKSTGLTYLVTGDTEVDRWVSIVRYFGPALKCDVLQAPHHGSRNGISAEVLSRVQPHTVLVSAGVNNSYGHPHPEATMLYQRHAHKYWRTNYGEGQSLRTSVMPAGVNTYLFKV